MATYDLVLRGATLFDGSTERRREGDVAVEGDRIVRVGDVEGTATTEFDVSGLALAPGFIDVHTHDDFAALVHPDMGFKVRGGVTTCIVGNCGMGCAPHPQAMAMASAFHPNASFPEWDGYGGYLSLLDGAPASVNIGVLAGHGTIRLAVLGGDTRAPRSSEMNRMKSLLDEGLEAGVFGLSSGLIYEPGKHAGTRELIELAAAMQGTRGLYTTHMRDEGLGLLGSVAEAIEIGESAGVGVQISHHKAAGKGSWGLVKESLKLIEAAQQKGLDIHADQYPYTAGSTVLAAVVQHGNMDSDGGTLHEMTGEDIVVASTRDHPSWEGQSIAQLAASWDVAPHEAAERIYREEPGTTVILHSIDENDVRTVMRHPSTMIGSDGIPTLEGKPHPRLYNSFARVLGHYSRELGLFDMETAIHKMTGLPAAKFGLTGRGAIREGAFADLVAFDPEAVIDLGTFEEPNRYPAGIHHVFVNGKQVIRGGEHTGSRPGRALRRED